MEKIKYELHLPLVMLTNKQLEKGPDCGVSPDELIHNLKRGLDNLKESLEICSNIIMKIIYWTTTRNQKSMILSIVRCFLSFVAKGQIKPKSRLARRRFSQKTNGQICFVCCKE